MRPSLNEISSWGPWLYISVNALISNVTRVTNNCCTDNSFPQQYTSPFAHSDDFGRALLSLRTDALRLHSDTRNVELVLLLCVAVRCYLLSRYSVGFNMSDKWLTFWCRNYFFFNFSTPVCKMWIIQEPNTLELWNKLNFEEEKKTESVYHV